MEMGIYTKKSKYISNLENPIFGHLIVKSRCASLIMSETINIKYHKAFYCKELNFANLKKNLIT